MKNNNILTLIQFLKANNAYEKFINNIHCPIKDFIHCTLKIDGSTILLKYNISFHWQKTKEGWEYWNIIYQNYKKHIKFYESIQGRLKMGQPTEVQASKMISDLESRRRVIMRMFETKEVKPFILKEEEPIKPLNTIEQTLPAK